MWAHIIARDRGYANVDSMLESVDTAEFNELIAAYRQGLDPEGWLQIATFTADIVNKLEELRVVLTGSGSQPQQRTPVHFLPPNYRKLFGVSLKQTQDHIDRKLGRMHGPRQNGSQGSV